MAVTIARVARVVAGNEAVRYVDVTGPASYTTGGETLAAADIVALGTAGSAITDLIHFDAETATGGQSLYLDRTNSKVKYYNGTTEIASTTNLSAVKSRVRVVHRVANG